MIALKPHKGQYIWKLDISQKKITKVNQEDEKEKNCMYCVAINYENADRKFGKRLIEVLKLKT